METAAITAWTFVAECPIPEDVQPLLVDGETQGRREAREALEAELSFYARVMGLTLAEPVDPIAIEPSPGR